MQEAAVALLVITAMLVSVWKLMPARLRLRALLAMNSWMAKRPHLGELRERVLKPRIQAAMGAGCAGCAANVNARHPHR